MDNLTPYLIFAAGVLPTILVAKYYFKRTTNKSIGVFQMQVSEAFAGVERDVRERMTFTFEGHEVDDITQVEFLVANDGDTAISDLINPLTLTLPQNTKLLDASVLHRNPEELDVHIDLKLDDANIRSLMLNFPLLNRGEFFLVKLLVAGKLKTKDIAFSLLGDDLPRKLSLARLPQSAYRERKFRPNWVPFIVGVVIALSAFWLIWVLSLVQAHEPQLFPTPWDTFIFSWQSAFLTIPSVILLLVLGLIALGLILIGVFDDLTERGPRFPLPRKMRNRYGVFPFEDLVQEAAEKESSPE